MHRMEFGQGEELPQGCVGKGNLFSISLFCLWKFSFCLFGEGGNTDACSRVMWMMLLHLLLQFSSMTVIRGGGKSSFLAGIRRLSHAWDRRQQLCRGDVLCQRALEIMLGSPWLQSREMVSTVPSLSTHARWNTNEIRVGSREWDIPEKPEQRIRAHST